MSKKFQRKIEDFVCENCGEFVKGNGYTNHCPACLWSKHVDNNPGDRQNDCQGLMEPIEAFFKKDTWHLIQKCQKCGKEKVIKLNKEDSLDSLEKIIKKREVGRNDI